MVADDHVTAGVVAVVAGDDRRRAEDGVGGRVADGLAAGGGHQGVEIRARIQPGLVGDALGARQGRGVGGRVQLVPGDGQDRRIDGQGREADHRHHHHRRQDRRGPPTTTDPGPPGTRPLHRCTSAAESGAHGSRSLLIVAEAVTVAPADVERIADPADPSVGDRQRHGDRRAGRRLGPVRIAAGRRRDRADGDPGRAGDRIDPRLDVGRGRAVEDRRPAGLAGRHVERLGDHPQPRRLDRAEDQQDEQRGHHRHLDGGGPRAAPPSGRADDHYRRSFSTDPGRAAPAAVAVRAHPCGNARPRCTPDLPGRRSAATSMFHAVNGGTTLHAGVRPERKARPGSRRGARRRC